MNNEKIIYLAQQFLDSRKVGYVLPGGVGRVDDERVEVIFAVPEAFDPKVVIIDPSDVRVWVYRKSGKVEMIPQI